MTPSTRLGLAAALALAASCGPSEPATQLVLVSDTNIGLIEEVEFNILGPDDRREKWTAKLAEQKPPFYLTLVRSVSKLGPFTITVTGRGAEGFAMSRKARVWFFPGETLVVPLHLSESCMKLSCTDQQCAEGRCMATDMEHEDLEPWTGEPPRLDDGRDQQSMDPVTGGDDDGAEPGDDEASEPGDESDGTDVPGGHEGDDTDIPGGHEGDDQDPVELDAGLDNGREDAGLDDGRR